MLKNNGITLITLTIMITVILILTSIFIATGLGSINESKEAKIKNEIHQLEQAISNRYTSYVKNDGNISLVGDLPITKWTSVNECIEDIILTLDDEEKDTKRGSITSTITRDYDDFVRVITSGDILNLELENFSTTNEYVVDYYTGAVYGPIND